MPQNRRTLFCMVFGPFSQFQYNILKIMCHKSDTDITIYVCLVLFRASHVQNIHALISQEDPTQIEECLSDKTINFYQTETCQDLPKMQNNFTSSLLASMEATLERSQVQGKSLSIKANMPNCLS